MRHDHHKKCLDDSLVIDTSSGPSRGCSMTVAIVGTYEQLTVSSEEMIQISMIRMLLKRLA
jgi:hypothetical protein